MMLKTEGVNSGFSQTNSSKDNHADSKSRDRKIVYFHHDELSIFGHGRNHERKPFRAKLAHSLLKAFGIYEKFLEPIRPRLVSLTDIGQFHSDNYIAILRFVQEHMNTKNAVDMDMKQLELQKEKRNGNGGEREQTDNGSWTNGDGSLSEHVEGSLSRFNLGTRSDSPNTAFAGLLDYCRMYTTGTLGCTSRIISGEADVGVNWYGGMSHARNAAAYAGCYVNDCILGILMLLRKFERILYINFDAQHCDAVEEAFYTTNKVMTVSFHAKPKDGVFPGTGGLEDIGYAEGHGYSVNIPLDSDIKDGSLISLFKSVITKIKTSFSPQVILYQSGSNLLAGDRLSNFNCITINAHVECLRIVCAFDLPLILLGGGGMNIANTARLWAVQTAIVAGSPLEPLCQELDENLEYREYFGPEYKILVKPDVEFETCESVKLNDLERIVLDNLDKLGKA